MKAKRSNNRPKSKNNPNGKAGKAKADWREYSERRRAGGLNRSGRMSRMADRARGPMGMDAGAPDRRVSAIPVPIAKSETKGSCRGPVGRFQMHPDDPEACGLKRACGRSRYRLRVSGIDPAVLQKIAARTGADGRGRRPPDGRGRVRRPGPPGADGRKIRRARRQNA
ncbi:MAG: hypothetical protein OXI27_02810 [Thaumarchaeota archaeon]|nr:hypothetical protein [Nitrososphaerota archaeon]